MPTLILSVGLLFRTPDNNKRSAEGLVIEHCIHVEIHLGPSLICLFAVRVFYILKNTAGHSKRIEVVVLPTHYYINEITPMLTKSVCFYQAF